MNNVFYVVSVGNVGNGFKFFGPFHTYEDALDFGEQGHDGDWNIHEIIPAPDDN